MVKPVFRIIEQIPCHGCVQRRVKFDSAVRSDKCTSIRACLEGSFYRYVGVGIFALRYKGTLYYRGLTLISAGINYHMSSKAWDDITLQFPNFNGCIVEVWKREVISSQCCNWLCMMGFELIHVSKMVPWCDFALICSVPSRHLNQCWLGNWTQGTNVSEVRIGMHFFQQNSFENIISKVSVILFRPIKNRHGLDTNLVSCWHCSSKKARDGVMTWKRFPHY